MKTIQDAYVVAAVRSPVGKAKGVFRNLRPDDLLSKVLQGLLEKVPQVEPREIQDIIIGCAMPEGEQGMNVARIASLLAGFPNHVPGVTVNRFCASGLQAIAMAAERISLGVADAVIAGGIESMSRVPIGGFSYSVNPSVVQEESSLKGVAFGMGITAERVASVWKVSREAQDLFALQSHDRAIKAQMENSFLEEITPISFESYHPNLNADGVESKIHRVFEDQGPRRGSTLEALSKLKPVFSKNGTVTAGNSSQMSDGAGALLLVSESFLNQHDLLPLARFLGYQVVGVAPEYMGVGPVEAIPKVLSHAGLKLEDISWIELNEAFAAQSLAVIQSLELNPALVNPLGGAIALGHPLGATGAVRSATLVHGLRRQKTRYGMVTMCIGTGMGAASIFEAI